MESQMHGHTFQCTALLSSWERERESPSCLACIWGAWPSISFVLKAISFLGMRRHQPSLPNKILHPSSLYFALLYCMGDKWECLACLATPTPPSISPLAPKLVTVFMLFLWWVFLRFDMRAHHVLFVLFIPHTRNIFHLKLGTIIRALTRTRHSRMSCRFTHAMCVHARSGQNLTTTTPENICYIS